MFKKLEYIRFPLRLGHDVFGTNRISKTSIEKFKKLMTTYKLMLELYEVDDYMFCATSAMRESENGPELVKQMREAPLAPIETRYGGEHVDLEWERKDGHAHASARYGVASRFTAPTRPAEEIDDSSVTPQEVRDSYFQQRLEQLEQAELEEFLEV